MSESHVLVIDLGTSGPKVALVSESGRIVGSARTHLNTIFGADGLAEQDAEQVWTATVEAMSAALAAADVNRSSVIAVLPGSQYSSVIPVRADGTPTMNMITWMDQRGGPKRLAKLDSAPSNRTDPRHLYNWVRHHGLAPVEPGLTLCHMRWIRYARPDVYEQTTAFLEPMDYLAMRMTGRATANQCSAFMMMIADNRKLGGTEWDPLLVKQSQIDVDKLPPMIEVGSVVGELLPDLAESLGLDSSTVVLSGMNDSQAGALATGAFRGDHAGLSIGTTAVVLSHVPKKKTDLLHTMFTMPSPTGDCHLLSGENGIAGGALEHFMDKVVFANDGFPTPPPEDRYKVLEQVAGQAPAGARGVLFTPWLRGSLAPKANGKRRGSFTGIGLDTGRADMARAVLEGVAFNLRWMQGPAEKFLKRSISSYRLYGGGAQSNIWGQILADVLDRPVHKLADPGFAISQGLGMFALEKLGLNSLDRVDEVVKVSERYQPNALNRGVYDDAWGRFKKMV